MSNSTFWHSETYRLLEKAWIWRSFFTWREGLKTTQHTKYFDDTRLVCCWRILLLTANCEHAFGSAQFKAGLSVTNTIVKEACMILLGHWILKCHPDYLTIPCHLVLTLNPPLLQNISEYNNPNAIFFTYPTTQWSQKSIFIVVTIFDGHIQIWVLYIQECKEGNPSQR